MFHPRKRPRFTSSGKLAPLSDDEEEINTNLTPPEKYTTEIPSFESLFAIPLNFILTHVRNPNEATLLYEIGTIGSKIDTLVQFLVDQLQQEEVLDRKWRSTCTSTDPLATAYIPSLAQINNKHFHHRSTLTSHFHSCVNALNVCKQSLAQYVEMNKSVADELLAEGCVALSANKLSVAKSEELLLNRIQGFLSGVPFVNSSISWESLMADKPSLADQKTIHNPNIVKTQTEDSSQEKGTPNPRPTIKEPELSPIHPPKNVQPSVPLQRDNNLKTNQQNNNNTDVDKRFPFNFENMDTENNTGSDGNSSSSSSGNNSNSININSSSSSGSNNNNSSNNYSGDNSSGNVNTSKENQSSSGMYDSEKGNNENDSDFNAPFYGNSQLSDHNEINWEHSQLPTSSPLAKRMGEQLSQTNTQLVNNDDNYT